MAKFMYSLMLDDGVVAEIDRMAARQGTSRSMLIEHILAAHVGRLTPRMLAQEILSVVEQTAQEWGLRPSLSPGGTLTLRTALRYKYNPSLCYMVELYDDGETLGELRVALRSQNEALLAYMQAFFRLWCTWEERYLPPPGGRRQALEAKRFLRTLRRPAQEWSGEETGEAIAAYVALLDGCLQTYVARLDNPGHAEKAAEQRFVEGLVGLGGGLHL